MSVPGYAPSVFNQSFTILCSGIENRSTVCNRSSVFLSFIAFLPFAPGMRNPRRSELVRCKPVQITEPDCVRSGSKRNSEQLKIQPFNPFVHFVRSLYERVTYCRDYFSPVTVLQRFFCCGLPGIEPSYKPFNP